jgi:hypothetical protein
MVTISMEPELRVEAQTDQEHLVVKAIRTEITSKMAKIIRAYKRWGGTEELNTLINTYSAEARGIVDAAIRMHKMGVMSEDMLDVCIIDYHTQLVTRITVWHNATKNS